MILHHRELEFRKHMPTNLKRRYVKIEIIELFDMPDFDDDHKGALNVDVQSFIVPELHPEPINADIDNSNHHKMK